MVLRDGDDIVVPWDKPDIVRYRCFTALAFVLVQADRLPGYFVYSEAPEKPGDGEEKFVFGDMNTRTDPPPSRREVTE